MVEDEIVAKKFVEVAEVVVESAASKFTKCEVEEAKMPSVKAIGVVVELTFTP